MQRRLCSHVTLAAVQYYSSLPLDRCTYAKAAAYGIQLFALGREPESILTNHVL
jgi:hypothetical protein